MIELCEMVTRMGPLKKMRVFSFPLVAAAALLCGCQTPTHSEEAFGSAVNHGKEQMLSSQTREGGQNMTGPTAQDVLLNYHYRQSATVQSSTKSEAGLRKVKEK